MSHGLWWRLGGVPPGEMSVDRHARQPKDEGTGGKHNVINIQTFDKLPPFPRLDQQFKHPVADGVALGEQTLGRLEINKGAGVHDFEMGGIGERPLQIAPTDRFKHGKWVIGIDSRLGFGDGLRQPAGGRA
jgi:hypothetical protein